MRNPFVRVGKVANDVVIDLATRRKPHVPFQLVEQMLKASTADLQKKENARLEVERGKALITKGIHCIRDNSSPEDAIKFMEDTLAAIRGA